MGIGTSKLIPILAKIFQIGFTVILFTVLLLKYEYVIAPIKQNTVPHGTRMFLKAFRCNMEFLCKSPLEMSHFT